ncbi:site-specific DNA-methyltransferase, partial [bacterium]|nr:site-specific DNA-methyltransferase [bacterium]
RDLPEEKIDILINPDARTPSEMFPNEMAGKPFPILKEVKGKEVNNDKGKPVNLLIEGDNYHSLAVLNFTHQEAIDLIYIDPPYNTGNDDFIYNDKIKSGYVKKDDPFRHSKWLAFMEKRLKLAKNLLKKDGVIFMSIDDNEFAQLKLLADEIFDEKNFIIDVIWNSRKSVSSDAIISLNHNHTLAYAKDSDTLREIVKNGLKFKLQTREEKFSNPDNDPRGPWTADPFDAPNIRPNLTYSIKNPKTGKVFMPPTGRCWRTTKEEYERFLKEGRIIFGKNGTSKPQLKRYLSVAEEKGLTPKSIWDDVGTTTNGTQELEGILGEKKFNNPKPISLIRRILELTTDKNSIVLDFMAGSGTTGHAVLEANKEDGGMRQFILCTDNENNICTDVCYPRLRKIIKGYKNVKDKSISGLGGNLKYYTCDFVEAEPTDKNKRKLVSESTEMLCIRENAFELVLDEDDFKIFKNNDRYLGIIFYEEAINAFKKTVKKINGHFNTYVFSVSDDPHEKQFADVKNKVTLCAIPEVILKVYREIFK